MNQRANDIVHAMRDWASSMPKMNVLIAENDSPAYDPKEGDDYRLAWEISLTPQALTKAKLQVAVTNEGGATLGIESWQRIAARLGLACSQATAQRFVAGFEPDRHIDPNCLIAMCDSVSRGELIITAYRIFHRLFACTIHMQEQRCASPRLSIGAGATAASVVSVIGLAESVPLSYSPWADEDNITSTFNTNGQQ